MELILRSAHSLPEHINRVFIVETCEQLADFGFSENEIDYLNKRHDDEKNLVIIQRLNLLDAVRFIDAGTPVNGLHEKLRKDGWAVEKKMTDEKADKVAVIDLVGRREAVLALVEGLALSTYRFDGYKTEAKSKRSVIHEILVVSSAVEGADLITLTRLTQAVFVTRNLVNEPVGSLNAAALGSKALDMAQQYGFKAEVFDKSKIEALKFGGLLAVNRGSVDPPTFTVMEWKPEGAVNDKPYVLVGKGVVFDTGGINLKTPPGSLDTMKCDMGGAGVVLGAMMALAANKVPLHVVGLMPATDNRPGGNALVPGDIIKMHSGKTVEVINTDAEGRIILADALSYAERFNPELVVDLATLTGAAAVAIGTHGMVGMGTAGEVVKAQLENAGEEMCERVVWFPFWEEYDEEIKSEIADIKNLGGREGGAITAGKFLSHFVKAPWIHLDIAGPAFSLKENNYRGNGASGVGVRLLFRFFQKIAGGVEGATGARKLE